MGVSGDRDDTNSPSVLNKQRVSLFRTSFYGAFKCLRYTNEIGQGPSTTLAKDTAAFGAQ